MAELTTWKGNLAASDSKTRTEREDDCLDLRSKSDTQ